MENETVTSQQMAENAIAERKAADDRIQSAIAALLERQEAARKEVSDIDASLAVLGYRKQRKARTPKIRAEVPVGAPKRSRKKAAAV